MSPRWLSSRQSAWGGASTAPSGSGLKPIIGVALVVFLVGALAGYALGASGRTGADETHDVDAAVIDPADSSLAAVAAAAKSPDGAVKAATAIVTGLPNLALQTASQQQSTVQRLLARNAEPNLAADLQKVLSLGSDVLIKPGAELTSRVFIAPLSYRVAMQGDSRATVTIWYVIVIADSVGPEFESIWSNDVLQLAWEDGWRVASFKTNEGPTPPLVSTGGKFSTYNDLVPVVNGGAAYRYAISRR